MSALNLKELMISLTDFKKQLSDIITNRKTKLIVKNNEPVSVIMPYSEYISLVEERHDTLTGIGQDITFDNGVQIMVTIEKDNRDYSSRGDVAIKTYIKMKTTGEYKLHYTSYSSPPNDDANLTIEEIMEKYRIRSEEKNEELK